jgi:hypothetical protein
MLGNSTISTWNNQSVSDAQSSRRSCSRTYMLFPSTAHGFSGISWKSGNLEDEN